MPAQKQPESPETRAAVARVYSALRIPIVDGEMPPGTRIKIDAVARDLGVSQTPVREALQRLESDDLLVYTPGRGYRTTPMLDFKGLRSLFEFRLLVEPWAARSVATDRLSNPGPALAKELADFERIADRDGDVRQMMLAHDAHFHDMILAAAGNDVVTAGVRANPLPSARVPPVPRGFRRRDHHRRAPHDLAGHQQPATATRPR